MKDFFEFNHIVKIYQTLKFPLSMIFTNITERNIGVSKNITNNLNVLMK